MDPLAFLLLAASYMWALVMLLTGVFAAGLVAGATVFCARWVFIEMQDSFRSRRP